MKGNRTCHIVSALIKFYMGMFYNRIYRSFKITSIHCSYHLRTLNRHIVALVECYIVKLLVKVTFFLYTIFAAKLVCDFLARTGKFTIPSLFSHSQLGFVFVFTMVTVVVLESLTKKKSKLIKEQVRSKYGRYL